MNELNSDLILHIAQYVNVIDAASWMKTCKRYYYLVHQLRRVLGPEMNVAAAATITTIAARDSSFPSSVVMIKEAMQGLRQVPSLALCCNNTERSNTHTSSFVDDIISQVPPTTIILGAVSSSIQSCLNDGSIDCDSPSNVLLGNLGSDDKVTIQPFLWESHNVSSPTPRRRRRGMQWDGTIQQDVKDNFSLSTTSSPSNLGDGRDDDEYKVFIIYGCGAGCSILEEFITLVQSLHPNAALVGGICSSGYVSKLIPREQQSDPGILSSKRIAVLKQMYKTLGGPSSILQTITEKHVLVQHVYDLLQKQQYIVQPNIEDGIFGVALKGDVPIRSVVSRGVKSLTPPDTTLLVKEARFFAPSLRHDWQQHQLNPNTDRNTTILEPGFHVINSIIDKDTGKEWNLLNFLASHNQEGVDFCGIRRRHQRRPIASASDANDMGDHSYEDSFELYALDLHGDKLKIPISNSDLFIDTAGRAMSLSEVAQAPQQLTTSSGDNTQSLECDLDEAQIDFFSLDGPSCQKHVDTTMKQLKEQTERENDSVLAAIMFSCAGRGPSPGWLMRKRMADATAFSDAFHGEVPCIGFYAGGEIGPLATAPAVEVSSNLFQKGKAALQGFTAVFALFIAPKVDLRHVDIDDSPVHVNEFITKQLHVPSSSSSE